MPSTLTDASNVGVGDRHPDVCLGSEVHDPLRSALADDRVERLADVVHVQGRGSGHLLALALREIVDDVHLVAAREERLDDVRADESGTAGDERLASP